MAEAVVGADRRIRSEAAGSSEREGLGTTLTALLLEPADARLVIVHVGDSRAYLIGRGGGLRQLTRDHTWVQEQVDAGALPAGEARGHPRANILTHALGVSDRVTPDVLERDARPGDVYLLYTDGLTNMLTDVVIERIVRESAALGLAATARALVDAANEAGGIDNITAVLVEVEQITRAG